MGQLGKPLERGGTGAVSEVPRVGGVALCARASGSPDRAQVPNLWAIYPLSSPSRGAWAVDMVRPGTARSLVAGQEVGECVLAPSPL